MRVFLSALCVIVWAGIAVAQTPAESNPEAVHISTTYGIPQLNGRLMMPGEGYDNLSIGPQLTPINDAWKQYAESYRMPTKGLRELITFFRRRPEMFRQLVTGSTRVTPDGLAKMMSDDLRRLRYRVEYAPHEYGLDEFDMRALNTSMEATAQAMRHEPAAERIPVTLLLPAGFGSYDFERGAFYVRIVFDEQWFLKDNWQYIQRDGGGQMNVAPTYMTYPEQNAQALARALDVNRFGKNVFFVGIEADVSPNGHSPDIQKVIYALDPTLTQRFFERDYAAERAQKIAARDAENRAAQEAEAQRRQQAAEAAEAKTAAEQAAEGAGFERDVLAPRFETAGLVLGAPPPEALSFTRYNAIGRYFPIPALEAFFHANVPGGQIAFLTHDATATGNVVYVARVFENENVTRDALMQTVTQKLGRPSSQNGSTTAFWYPSSLPKDRLSACRLGVAEHAVGNAALHSNGWTRHPLFVDPNMFNENCGLVANLNTFSKKYGAVDTTYFNAELEKALALQRAEKAAAETEAQAEIDF